MNIYGTIEKVTANDDGTVTVCGIASTETRDSQGEVVLASAMKQAIPDYMKFGAVREMHQPKAAGTALAISVDDATKTTNFEALIVDPVAVRKVKAGVYKGFSIGGRVSKRKVDDQAVIESIQLTEISLVDRPANPEACIGIWKADGAEPTNPAADEPQPTEEGTMPDEPKQGEGQAIPEEKPPVVPDQEPVEKAGKKYSKSTATAIKGLRKSMKEGAECLKAFDDLSDEDEGEPDGDEPMKAQLAETLQKAAGLEDQLKKVTDENQVLKAEIEKLKAQPAPGPLEAALKAVEKKDDITIPATPEAPKTEPTAHDLIKAAQSKPRPMF